MQNHLKGYTDQNIKNTISVSELPGSAIEVEKYTPISHNYDH